MLMTLNCIYQMNTIIYNGFNPASMALRPKTDDKTSFWILKKIKLLLLGPRHLRDSVSGIIALQNTFVVLYEEPKSLFWPRHIKDYPLSPLQCSKNEAFTLPWQDKQPQSTCAELNLLQSPTQEQTFFWGVVPQQMQGSKGRRGLMSLLCTSCLLTLVKCLEITFVMNCHFKYIKD